MKDKCQEELTILDSHKIGFKITTKISICFVNEECQITRGITENITFSIDSLAHITSIFHEKTKVLITYRRFIVKTREKLKVLLEIIYGDLIKSLILMETFKILLHALKQSTRCRYTRFYYYYDIIIFL